MSRIDDFSTLIIAWQQGTVSDDDFHDAATDFGLLFTNHRVLLQKVIDSFAAVKEGIERKDVLDLVNKTLQDAFVWSADGQSFGQIIASRSFEGWVENLRSACAALHVHDSVVEQRKTAALLADSEHEFRMLDEKHDDAFSNIAKARVEAEMQRVLAQVHKFQQLLGDPKPQLRLLFNDSYEQLLYRMRARLIDAESELTSAIHFLTKHNPVEAKKKILAYQNRLQQTSF